MGVRLYKEVDSLASLVMRSYPYSPISTFNLIPELCFLLPVHQTQPTTPSISQRAYD